MKLLRFFIRMVVVFGIGLGVVVVKADGIVIGAVCIAVVVAWSWGDWPIDL